MSAMSDNLLKTLEAVSAKEELLDEAVSKINQPMRPGIDYDESTGEWIGERPDGYQPIPEPPSLEEIESKESRVPEFDKSDASVDYRRVRDTTYAIQEATMFMMGQAAKLAAATEAPRAFSVFRELGELMRGLNKDLMENQKTFKAVTQGEDPPTDTTVDVTTSPDGTTTVSVGKTPKSSRDLLRTIEDARKRAEERAASKAKKEEAEAEDADITEVEEPTVQEEVKEDGVSEA